MQVRIKLYNEYKITAKSKPVSGLAIEFQENEDGTWELATFMQTKEEFIHVSFLEQIKSLEEMGYKISWEI